MKKQILSVGLFMMVLSSCSSSDSEKSAEEMLPGVQADYFAKMDLRVDGFVVNNDGNVYAVGPNALTTGSYMYFKKIDPSGNVTIPNDLKSIDFTKLKLTNTETGDVLMVTSDTYITGNKIFRLENNFSEINSFYTMKPTSSPYAKPIRLSEICNNGDGTYFVFDGSTMSMKRVAPTLNTDVLMAGSGKAGITDGTALNASFGYVSQIISRSNILYVIDGSNILGETNTIRKIEYTTEGWKVTTLISTTTDLYKNIAIDSKNNFYVLVSGKGVYKLNLQNNSMSLYIDDRVKVIHNDTYNFIDFKFINFMSIKNDDLYTENYGELIKVSNFQSKLSTYKK
jgi:hypothetical protein